jgi:hypothetical protein
MPRGPPVPYCARAIDKANDKIGAETLLTLLALLWPALYEKPSS